MINAIFFFLLFCLLIYLGVIMFKNMTRKQIYKLTWDLGFAIIIALASLSLVLLIVAIF